ncbi:hypothetical protein RP20_CCG008984 [Aedes albopictus]|nr:hypothetical protein RP20_CCG008984 [Aedes albopictus]
MADESEEVRSLLSRHRLTIVRDLVHTNLVQVLVKNSVINEEDNALINGAGVDLEKKCDQLIEIVAKDGFEKFKQFCYAIENECSQLISDLINDKLYQSGEEKIVGGYPTTPLPWTVFTTRPCIFFMQNNFRRLSKNAVSLDGFHFTSLHFLYAE